jgi:hypothetical protein
MSESVKKTKSNLKGAGPGRPKGIPNKATTELKTMILGALEESGGVEYLVRRANDPRTASAFLTLVGKVLPLQVSNAEGESLKHSIEVTFRAVQ